VGAIGLGVVVAVRLGGSVRRRLASVSNALWDVVENDLAHMTASFREIAMGNLTAPRYVCARDTLPEGGEPEIEALLASYNGLVNALCEMSARIDDAANDAQRRKEAEERLVYVRQHDELTGLANRQLLQNHLESAISLHPSRAALAVAYVKVVGFKNIEDNFGHDAGNELIRQAAERLAGALGGAHALARGGVDEFIVLLEDVLDAQDAGDRLTRIIAGVSDAYVVGQRNVFVRLAASVSTYPRDGATAEELLRNAHTALEFAEDRGHADVSVYAPAMRHESVQRLTVATDLEHAFRSGQFELYYQPIVDVRAGRISRFEALLRWRHRELGLLAPKAFIDVAEATGIIDHIGEWVLHDACRQARSWLDRGHDVCVSVNVSARQLYGAGLLNAVDGALAQSGLPADHLEVELTENMILRNRESAVETLSALQKRGVHLAIDDFGTGYSWYGYLRYFAPNTLKLDRMFVANINRNPVDQSIAQAMIVLGHELDLKVIAEGVEERSQMLTLRRLDCDEMQGYLFAPPMTPADCERLLREGVPGIA
jgi:diguanylate cyclase (GGDEF)-like protein